jgi:hypothetical protein
MPHATSQNKLVQKGRHHHRRYSWPPCIHLIDVSNIHIPLPALDEDPFAHFLAEPDKYDEHIVYTAGILPIEQTAEPPTHAEKAFTFRTSILRRWTRFWDRYRAMLHSNRSIEARRHAKTMEVEDHTSLAIPRRTSSKSVHYSKEGSKLSRPEPTPVQLEYYRAAKGHRKRHPEPSQRRSWHAPSPALYSIVETLDEEED